MHTICCSLRQEQRIGVARWPVLDQWLLPDPSCQNSCYLQLGAMMLQVLIRTAMIEVPAKDDFNRWAAMQTSFWTCADCSKTCALHVSSSSLSNELPAS